MSKNSIFVFPASSRASARAHASSNRKRKRSDQDVQTVSTSHTLSPAASGSTSGQSIEYTAVVTPAERSQRRLAGQRLDQKPPAFPFPHASATHKKQGRRNDEVTGNDDDNDGGSNFTSRPPPNLSLHTQHIAAMAALLHRCLMAGDYIRASRALGLLLRSEMSGKSVDIRKGDMWGAGAEILLRNQHGSDLRNMSSTVKDSQITRQGFERARAYYERLMVLYPQHKTWPDVVNARDFCTALFSSWVYLIAQESSTLRAQASTLSEGAFAGLLEANVWELEHANQVSEALDVHMRNAPYNNEYELIRLRAHIASWTADLLDARTELENEDESRYSEDVADEAIMVDDIERMAVDVQSGKKSRLDSNTAASQRQLARTLRSKLENM